MKKRRAAQPKTESHESDNADIGNDDMAVPGPTPPPKRYAFASNSKDIRPDFERISETIMVDDMHAASELVQKSLKIGARRSEHGVLMQGADDSNFIAYEGHRLAITAEFEFKRWEKRNNAVHAALWTKAEEQLILEGAKKGDLTNKAIEMKISTLNHDEWIDQEMKREKYRATVAAMKALAKEAGDRPETIRAMLKSLRGG